MVLYLIIFVFGALIGSFLNVCIYRIPRGQSIIWPSSRCPSCSNPINSYDNIPVLSYFILRARCRACSEKIPLRYPVVEALNAFSYLLVFWRFGPEWSFLVYSLLCSALIVITFIDLDFQIIPDRITLPGIPLGIVAGSFLLPDPFLRASDLGFTASLIGAISGFAFFYMVAFLSIKVLKKEGMGGGDIKMMAMLGGFLGWKAVILTTFLGSLFGSVIGIGLMAFRGREKGSLIPFGPFLALGAVVSLFFGQEILLWYLY
jgi:leader peptidase (prepilin peptidase) / N-methyltransferase